jgi:hypothetical protein
LDETNASFSITESMVSFLRIEAHHADDKAKRLRKQAAEIAEQFGITEESQHIYGTYVLYCIVLYCIVTSCMVQSGSFGRWLLSNTTKMRGCNTESNTHAEILTLLNATS